MSTDKSTESTEAEEQAPQPEVVEDKPQPKTVTLTEDQFNALMGTISELKEKVVELSEVQASAPQGGKPVFYSGGDPRTTKELLHAEKKEEILSGTAMRHAVDAAIQDFKKNPPRRY